MDDKTYMLTWEELIDHGNGVGWEDRHEISDYGFDWELKRIGRTLAESESYFNRLPEQYREGRTWKPPIRNIRLYELTSCDTADILKQLEEAKATAHAEIEAKKQKEAEASREQRRKQFEKLQAEFGGEE